MSRKRAIVEQILASLSQEIDTLARSAKAAHEAATHEESKAEDEHDTRGLEASYLAGAQMARIDSLKKTIAAFQFAEFKDFGKGQPIDVGALVQLGIGGKKFRYFLVGQGGGISITLEGEAIQLITPVSPVGEALLGRRVGDTIEVESQRGSREYEVLQVE